MATMYGADVAQLRNLAAQFDQHADRLETDRMTVGNAIQISAWVGPFAVRFRHQWESEHSRRVHDAALRLRDAAHKLRANADEQERTSAVVGAADVDACTVPGAGYAPYPVPTDVRVSVSDSFGDEVPRGAWTPAAIIHEFDQEGAYESGVTIRTIVRADGTLAHIIYVPGTQDWLSGGSNVYDGIDNVPAAFGLGSKGGRAVLEAMRQHGIGPDDPIMLAGHSQGALIVGGLAESPEFRGRYNLEGVLAYGADIRDRAIPADVAITQVINRADIVPGLTDLSPFNRAQNVNLIEFHRINASTPHEFDTSIGGRFLNAIEYVGNVIVSPGAEHLDHSAYAAATFDWYNANKAEWGREYGSFFTDADSRSTVSRYSFEE